MTFNICSKRKLIHPGNCVQQFTSVYAYVRTSAETHKNTHALTKIPIAISQTGRNRKSKTKSLKIN